MPPRTVSADDWRDLSQALAAATDLLCAYDAIAAEVSRKLNAPSCVVDSGDGGWRILAQSRGGLPLAAAALSRALDTIPSPPVVGVLDLFEVGLGRWTSVPLDRLGHATATLLVAGEWAGLEQLSLWIPFALAAVRDRQSRDDAARLVFDSYLMARRASRLGGVEVVGQRIVDQVARSLGAERIALAMYRPEEDCLSVIATHGYAAEHVRHARIGPGEWVMGHVYASGRPVVVADVRQIRRVSPTQQPYRTFSFAVIPIVAGRSTVGVLSATDKTDGSAFDRKDTLALRSFSSIAALALSAAQSDTDLRRLSRAANIDSLTGLFNRPYFDARLHEEVERAKRASSSLTLLMGDIDDFKSINDTYGHPAGDAVLQAVGHVMRSSVRVFDVCARYGGDEFAILMPTSDHASAIESAERIRRRLADHHHLDERLRRVRRFTISIGVAVLEPADLPADVVRRADEALYRAKADGKDTVRTAHPPRLPPAGVADPLWPSALDD